MSMRISIIGVLLITSSSLYSQTKTQKKADKYYQNMSYSEAIPLYEQLYHRDTTSSHAVHRLAACYQQINMPEKAEFYYARVVQSFSVQPHEVLSYVWALRSNQKYELSDIWMKKYQEMASADSRASKQLNGQSTFKTIQQNDGTFIIKPVSINSSKTEFSPSYLGDNQVVFVSSNHKKDMVVSRKHAWNSSPYFNLYSGQPDAEGDLTEVEPFSSNMNSKYHEGPVTFSKDGSKIFFTRNNYMKGKRGKDQKGVTRLKIYSSTKNTDGKWSEEMPFPFNSEEYSVGHPTLTDDGKTMYFVSDMPGGKGGTDIWKSTWDGAAWTTPTNVSGDINTEGNEMFPFIHSNGSLFYASNGHLGLGGLDLMLANAQGKGFGPSRNLGASINSSKDDFGLILNTSETKGYFSSNRSEGKGEDDIYSFTLNKPLKSPFVLKGKTMEKNTGKIVPSAKIVLLDAEGDPKQELLSDEQGNYQFSVDPTQDQGLMISKAGYDFTERTIPEKMLEDEKGLCVYDVELLKEGLKLLGKVTSKDHSVPIENAKVLIIDRKTKQALFNFQTKPDGTFADNLKSLKGDVLDYEVTVSANGYLTKTGTFQKPIGDEKVVNLNQTLDLSLSKISLGADLGKILNINPIYFDLNKDIIRPDAAKELDKIVVVMNENPAIVIELGSHTDCRSSMSYNQSLSDRRAKSSANYIKARISNPDRIYGKGYGESQLVNGCACEGAVKATCTEQEHQLNRRTEFKVIKM